MRVVAYVDDPLYLNPDNLYNLEDIENNQKLYWPSPNPLLFLLNFIENSICSYVYNWQHPVS